MVDPRANESRVDGPLRDVRILDLTHVWAGPLATRILSDLGAQIVKIERPMARGPRERVAAPIAGFIGGEPGPEPWNGNAAFVKLARNSQSLCLDLKATEGREIFLQLVEQADVVIENFSARAMPSLKLDYPHLKAANPRIIYVTMPGYGTYGAYRDRVAFGPTVEMMSGLPNLMGYGPNEPRNTAMALMDPTSAVTATSAVMAALRRRRALEAQDDVPTVTGTRVEQSLHEGGVSFSGPWLIEHQLGGNVESMGNRHPAMAPHGVFPCEGDDQWIAIACRDDGDWWSLARVVPGLDANWSLAERVAKADVIEETIAAYTLLANKHVLTESLQRVGVPAGPVNTAPDMLDDAQAVSREFFVPLDKNTPMPGLPVKMAGLSSSEWSPSPALGADNASVLRDWLNMADDDIGRLSAQGLIFDKPPL